MPERSPVGLSSWFAGTPDDLVAHLKSFEERYPGMQHINLSPPLTTPKDRIVEQYRMVGELVMFGMIEASITRRPSTPQTLSLASTTARASWPIRHVPTGCHIVVTTRFTHRRSQRPTGGSARAPSLPRSPVPTTPAT